MKRLALLALACSGFAGQVFGDTGRVAPDRVAPDQVMPAVFEQETVFLALSAPDHSTLRLYTDSGGGVLTLSAQAALRLQLPARTTHDEDLLRRFGPNVRVTHASDYMVQRWPALKLTEDFVVMPGVVAFSGWPAGADGGFGTTWFAGHTWTWDYPRRQLILRGKNWRPATTAHRVAVTFKADGAGHRRFNYPRMSIRIDGVDIPVLFDTGASTVLTPNALKALDDGQPARRATSMIIHSRFESWHVRHPDWRVVDDAQLATHSRMILVPAVEIAGVAAGPVWFTERDNDDLQQALGPVMSDAVDGAIGGNAFAGLIVSVDYLTSRAWVTTANSSRH